MIQIGARPDAGFDRPIEMLRDCHRRIERFLEDFLWVARHAPEPLSPEDGCTLDAAMRYFATSGPTHTRDEEDSLFPRIRGEVASETMARLDADHARARSEHDAADALARRWRASGRLPAGERAALVSLLEALQTRYREHIALEEETIFPQAALVLDAATLAQVGREMARRRGLRRAEDGSGSR